MRIAYICADFGVPIFGHKGASIHLREMIEAFRRQGHSICIISPATHLDEDAPNPFRALASGDSEIELLPVFAEERHNEIQADFKRVDRLFDMSTRTRQEVRNLLYNLSIYDRALDFLRARGVDLIYERYTLFSIAGIRLANVLQVPHILEVNAPLAYEQRKMRGLEMKELATKTEQRIFRETGQVLAVSRPLKDYVLSCGVPADRVRVLPNAVHPPHFEPASAQASTIRSQYGLDDKCVIGFVGSLKPWHGTETLLEAFREVQAKTIDTHLLIVGDGPGRQELESYARDHGLSDSVTFTGKVVYDEIPDYIEAMDIAVAPYTPNENFYYSPIKIFEYMAMAKPVVAGKIGQVEEVIADDETGVLFEPGNVSQLSVALQRLCADSQLCQRMGEKARGWVTKERTWKHNAKQVLEIAYKLIERRQTAAKQ